MKKGDNYNWWEDPANAEAVERISWWNKPENKENFPLPISISEGDNYYVATFNDETKEILGEFVFGVAQGKTKEEAIEKLFEMVRLDTLIMHYQVGKYMRWVPLRIGPWKKMGGKWIAIFGIHIYFRYGKDMKGGTYIPFTKLNVSVMSLWKTHRKWKEKHWNA